MGLRVPFISVYASSFIPYFTISERFRVTLYVEKNVRLKAETGWVGRGGRMLLQCWQPGPVLSIYQVKIHFVLLTVNPHPIWKSHLVWLYIEIPSLKAYFWKRSYFLIYSFGCLKPHVWLLLIMKKQNLSNGHCHFNFKKRHITINREITASEKLKSN